MEGLHEHCSPQLPSLHIIIKLQEPQRYYHVLLIPSFLIFSFLKMQDLIVEQSSINLTKMEKIHFVDKLPLCATSKKEKKFVRKVTLSSSQITECRVENEEQPYWRLQSSSQHIYSLRQYLVQYVWM